MLPLSCNSFPTPDRSGPPLTLPERFSLYEEHAPTPECWWESFDSAELNELILRALTDNFTIQQAEARLRQALESARQSGAARFPSLSYSAEGSSTRTHIDTGVEISEAEQTAQTLNSIASVLNSANSIFNGANTGSGSGSSGTSTSSTSVDSERTITTDSYRFGLMAGYEVDLWGRIQAQYESARLNAQASHEDLYSARMTLSAEVSLRWLDVLGYRQGIALVHKQLESNQTMLELIELRYRKGMATALDVYQQRRIVAQTQAVLPRLEGGLQTAEHELATLLGAPPKTRLDLHATKLPKAGAMPDPGLPADLLARRPDVRASGLLLRAADWQVSAAQANRLPALSLSASASYGAEDWDLVFDNWMTSLAASITGPIFDGGRRKAEVARTQAVVDERLAAYRQTVITAVREVEDAMVDEYQQVRYLQALELQLAAAKDSYREALTRYRKGLNDYLPVLDALLTVQNLERDHVDALHARLQIRVQLCRALGGSWMRDLAVEKETVNHD